MTGRRLRAPGRDAASLSLAVSSSVNAAALATQLAFRVGGLVLLARLLGPHGQGEVALGYLVATLGASVAGLGLEVALLRSAARPETRSEARTAVWTQLLAVVALGGALLAVLETALRLPPALELGAAALPGLLFMRLAASCALGERRFWSFAGLTVLPWAANAVSLAVLAGLGLLTPGAALLAFATASACAALLSAACLSPWLRPRITRAPWRSEPYRTAARVFPGMLAQLGNYRLDQVLVAALLSRGQLGLYSVAVAASEVGTLPAQAVASASLPHAARGWRERDRRYLVGAAAGAALVLLVVPAFVLGVLFVLPGYRDSLLPFLVLLPGTCGLAASKVLAAVVTGRGEAWRASQAALATLAVTLAATASLVPLLGIAGAATASSIAYAFSAVLLLRTFRTPAARREAPLPLLRTVGGVRPA